MEQYSCIKRTREALFSYCESIPYADYVRRLDSFGGTSMCDLLVHVSYCYLNWIGRQGLQLTEWNEIPPQPEVGAVRTIFREIDTLVDRFIHTYEGKWDVPVIVEIPWQDEPEPRTPLYMFTHTITHEFHHKGQIVSIGRQLGHVPPMTDLIYTLYPLK